MLGLPKHYTVVSGTGQSSFALVAFDNALRQAGIGDYNLVKVSSILPPNCEYKESVDAEKGSIVYVAYSYAAVINDEMATTATAVAIPEQSSESGVIFEHNAETGDVEDIVRCMCSEAMANRNKSIREIKSTTVTVHGEIGKYVSAVSAVVMW
jgi:arginine decarboxylase